MGRGEGYWKVYKCWTSVRPSSRRLVVHVRLNIARLPHLFHVVLDVLNLRVYLPRGRTNEVQLISACLFLRAPPFRGLNAKPTGRPSYFSFSCLARLDSVWALLTVRYPETAPSQPPIRRARFSGIRGSTEEAEKYFSQSPTPRLLQTTFNVTPSMFEFWPHRWRWPALLSDSAERLGLFAKPLPLGFVCAPHQSHQASLNPLAKLVSTTTAREQHHFFTLRSSYKMTTENRHRAKIAGLRRRGKQS